jgi:hypothetical protein
MPCNYKEYPSDWKQIRARILIRANNRCEKCGLKNHIIISKKDRKEVINFDWHRYNELLKAEYAPSQILKRMNCTKVVLTIAHLDNDHRNENVTDDRLLALCQSCHLKMDALHHAENRKYGRNYRQNNLTLEL